MVKVHFYFKTEVTIPEPKPFEEQTSTQLGDLDTWIGDEFDDETKRIIKETLAVKPEDRDLNPDDIGKKQFTGDYTCPVSGILYTFNCLPNHKILDWSEFKAFADNEINVTQKI